ncbi:MAG: hypothetical protein WCS52_18315 [bacterium]
MKTTHIVTMITLVGLLTIRTSHAGNIESGRAGASSVGWFARTFGNLSWESAVIATTSPSDISWQVRRHVTYRATPVLTWEDGRETWDRGYGDCKAFAYCVADLCEAKGIVCWVSVVRPIGEHYGHAVTMGVWEGKIWMSSNGLYGEFKSLDETLKALSTIKGFNHKSLEFIPLSLM